MAECLQDVEDEDHRYDYDGEGYTASYDPYSYGSGMNSEEVEEVDLLSTDIPDYPMSYPQGFICHK